MQFWPRKRAKRIYPRCRTWPTRAEAKPLGFYGYKVEMIHAMAIDNRPKARTKGERVSMPLTIVECPPMRVFSVRFYKKIDAVFRVTKEILLSNELILRRKLSLPKTIDPKLDDIKPEDYDEIRFIAYTQSKLSGRAQKTPELFEIGLGGKPKDQLEFIKQHIGKEIRLSDVFSPGEQLDVAAVTKGKGFQGTVKRFGVAIRSHKSEKTKRGIGTLGPWHPNRVLPSVPQGGKMGFHVRTERNKLLVKISNENINPAGGFKSYGVVKTDYALIKGSLPGPSKRLIRLYKVRKPSTKLQSEAPSVENVVISK